MVILLSGDNVYRADQEIRRIAKSAGVQAEYIDAETLDQASLANLMKGVSLFQEPRVVVVRDLSQNTALWELAGQWASEVGSETTLIIREQKPDRRTKAYKMLVKQAELIDVPLWTERQHGLAEEWLGVEAQNHGVKLSLSQIKDIVKRTLTASERSGNRVIDQSMAMWALTSLQNTSEVTDEAIATVLPESATDAVFDLLETAASRDTKKLQLQLSDLRTSQDGYQVMALVASQWSQLLIILLGSEEDAGSIHPYVRQKLSALGKQFTRAHLQVLTKQLALLDTQTKSTSTAPWDALSLFLYSVANR